MKLYRLVTLSGIESITQWPPVYWHAFGPVYPWEGYTERAFDLLVDVDLPEDHAVRLQFLWEMVLTRHLNIETQLLPTWVYAWAMKWYHEYRRLQKYLQYTGVGIWERTPAFWHYRKPQLDQTYEEYAPRTCYIMTYQERLWMAELLAVDSGGVGIYELCYGYGGYPALIGRELKEYYETWDRFYWLYCVWRKLGFGPDWWVYNWWKWDTRFVGMLVRLEDRIYQLRLPATDPFIEHVPWRREGGLFGAPDYDGVYRDWWP